MLKEMSINAEYWENISINQDDLELLNIHLIEVETPLSPIELLGVLIPNRIKMEQENFTEEQSDGEKLYLPKDSYEVGETLVFPELDWKKGSLSEIRPGVNPDLANFNVAKFIFGEDNEKEFAIDLLDHGLNQSESSSENLEDPSLDTNVILDGHGDELQEKLIQRFKESDDFVYIAGKWFPKELIIDVNQGNLNLAEAVLDMNAGGPLSTVEMIVDVGLPEGVNPNLAEFSFDLALQEDPRFDEVGPEGEVAWFLKKGEPPEVLNTPDYLKYDDIEYDRSLLTDEMLALERFVDDELSPLDLDEDEAYDDEVEVRLIFPHWRAGTLPLPPRISRLFPTAYESPRIRFMLKDGETGEKFPGWVVRLEKYVYGLGDWYKSRGLMPGSYLSVRHGDEPGEVIITAKSHRSNKEWVRTALVGADGGIVYALLKQIVSATFDERMMIFLPADISMLEEKWHQESQSSLEKVVKDTVWELAKLNPQQHVHATELYSAVNMRMRTPPGPIMAMLASQSTYEHVGDLHYRIEQEETE